MPDFAEPLARLITEFKRLPGIGQKSAQRLAFHVLRAGREDAEHLAQAILDVKDKLGLCRVCNNISESELCLFCRDTSRDPTVVCVVEEAHNIVGIETTRGYAGGYHVLHGSLSPLRGIGPESLKIKGLVERIGRREIQDVILHGHSGGQRYRVRRRSYAVESHGRPAGNVTSRSPAPVMEPIFNSTIRLASRGRVIST